MVDKNRRICYHVYLCIPLKSSPLSMLWQNRTENGTGFLQFLSDICCLNVLELVVCCWRFRPICKNVKHDHCPANSPKEGFKQQKLTCAGMKETRKFKPFSNKSIRRFVRFIQHFCLHSACRKFPWVCVLCSSQTNIQHRFIYSSAHEIANQKIPPLSPEIC